MNNWQHGEGTEGKEVTRKRSDLTQWKVAVGREGEGVRQNHSEKEKMEEGKQRRGTRGKMGDKGTKEN